VFLLQQQLLQPTWQQQHPTDADKQFMQAAIQLSERAGIVERSGRCFGAVVVKDGEVLGEGYNQVCYVVNSQQGSNPSVWTV